MKRRSKKWSRAQRDLVYRRFLGRCYLCGRGVQNHDPASPSYATMDHVIPRSRGGHDTLDNLALSCLDCNQGKGNSLLAEKEPVGVGWRTLTRAQILRDLRHRLNSSPNGHFAACACKVCDRRSLALSTAIEALESLDDP